MVTDIDRMFRSELAALAEQPTESDLWALDLRLTSQLASVFDTPVSPHSDWDDVPSVLDAHRLPSHPADSIQPPLEQYPLHADTSLGLFPPSTRCLGEPVTVTQAADPLHIPVTAYPHHPQPTVHLSDVSLDTTAPMSMPIPMPMPVPVPSGPAVQIPMSASPSSMRLSASPTDAPALTDPSWEDMESDDFELACPSDSEFLPSPGDAILATVSAASANPRATPCVRPSRRTSRAMTNIPVPIPNLTKKSRGRKVPTSNGEPIYAASRDKTKRGVRTYTCQAAGCGKCFVRGEHLKRHIRSIHTDEKPWVCTYKDCSRAFSRRDNLNQHLRIHKAVTNDVT